MCLTQISTKRNRDKFLKEVSRRGYVRVYKVCALTKSGWCADTTYKAGLRIAWYNKKVFGCSNEEDIGFHVCLSLAKARREIRVLNWLSNLTIKVCYAKPKWLKGLSLRTKEASFTHLVFPKWDKGDMTIREFRKICND